MRDHSGDTALAALIRDLERIRDSADCGLDIIDGLSGFRRLAEGHGRAVDIDVLGHGLTARLMIAFDLAPVPDDLRAGAIAPAAAIDEIAAADVIDDDDAFGLPGDDMFADAPAAAEPPAPEAPAQPEPEPPIRHPDAAADVPAPSGPFDPAMIRSGPYAGRYPASHPMTDAEELRALELHAAGESAGEIARALNRDPRGFYHQMNALLAEAAPGDDAATPAAADPAPAAEPAAAVPQPAAPDPADDLSPSDRRALDRIVALGFPAIRGVAWTAGIDLDIMRGLSEGQKTAQVAADLGLDPAVVKARYHQLVPTTGIAVQATVLRVLRFRAEGGANV